MQIGEVITTGMSTRTPWFPRAADNAVFTFELISNPDSSTLTVTVLHKNHDDTGNGTTATGTFTQIATSGFYSLELSGLKEQVRFEVAATGGDVHGAVLYRILAPTWFNTADV